VSDTGKGISADFAVCFRPLLIAQITRVHKGLGLGLAIARHSGAARRHYPKAESQEARAEAATFTVKAPAPRRQGSRGWGVGEENPTLKSPSAPLPSRLNGLRVLVVDDEADVRKFVSTVLEECRAEAAVGSVEKALAALRPLKQMC